MTRIINPFAGHEDYGCFGCKPDHPHGLRMEFHEDGDSLVSTWIPRTEFEGFTGVVHGGIQSTLLDEVGGWFVMVKIGTAGVTKTMNIEYVKPALRANGPFVLRAVLLSHEEKIARLDITLMDNTGTVCTKGILDFYCYPEAIARKKLRFPGREAFFETL